MGFKKNKSSPIIYQGSYVETKVAQKLKNCLNHEIWDLWDSKRQSVFQITYQGNMAEATVAQKLNQGTIRQKGCNLLSGSFFGSFLDKQKRTYKSKYLCRNTIRNKK